MPTGGGKVGRVRPVPKRSLAVPEREAHRETDDVKHPPTAVRHLGAAGSDGIMSGPQAVDRQSGGRKS